MLNDELALEAVSLKTTALSSADICGIIGCGAPTPLAKSVLTPDCKSYS